MKTRNKVPLKLEWGQILSGAGQTLFFWTVVDLVKPLLGLHSDGDATSCRIALQITGWFAVAGWILQRRAAAQWPFNSPAVKKLDIEILAPALLVLIALAALGLTLLKVLGFFLQ